MVEDAQDDVLGRLGRGRRSVEASVGYSVGHRIRVEVQAVLREGPASTNQLAKIIRQPLGRVSHHIAELLADGVIEVAWAEQVGNVVQHYYRVVDLPYYSDEKVAALSEGDRQVLYAYILQATMAEAMASLWSMKIARDRRAFLAWKCMRLDAIGRDELADEEAESWARKEEIEGRAANRCAETGELGKMYVTTSLGFERSRTVPPEPADEDGAPKTHEESPPGSSDPTVDS